MMKVWVVDWSEDDNDFIQPAGKTYHKTEELMNQFVAKMRASSPCLMPLSKTLAVAASDITAVTNVCGLFEDWK